MKNSALYLLCLFLVLSCCNKDDLSKERINDEGDVYYLPCRWKTPIHKNGPKTFTGSIRGNLVFGENILITTTDGPDKDNLTMISVESGEEVWSWSDFYQPGTELPYFRHFDVYHNILHWITGSRHYALDVKTGKTLWRDRKDSSYLPRMSNRSDTVYFTGSLRDTLPNYISYSGYRRSIYNPDLEQFLIPPFNFDMIGEGNRITSIENIIPYDDKLIVITTQGAPNWYYTPNLNLYDKKSGSWIYHSVSVVPLSQNNSVINPTIYNDRIYFTAGIYIVCHDIATGQRIWQKHFPADFLFSGFVIAEGILIANCEDQVLYGVDPENGNILWKGRGSGTSCPVWDRVLNGVLYFTGGAPNDVFAVDIHTGKTLWALEAEEYEPSGKWKGDTYVIPGENGQKGKVVACTYTHCYCFDAAR